MKRLALLLPLLFGCATLAELIAQAFQKPRVTFKEARVSSVTFDALTLDTVWRVENPNPVGLSLARADYKLSVEGKQVVAGKPPNGFRLAADGVSELAFPAGIKLPDLFPLAQDLANKEFAAYRVEGVVGVQTPIGVIDFPLKYDGQFEVPKVPKIELQPPRIKRVSMPATTVEFPIAITNKNSFALPLTGLNGALKVGGVSVGRVEMGNLGMLDGKGTRVVTVPIDFDLWNAAGIVAQAVQGGTAPVELEAQLTSGASSTPIDVTQVLKFIR